MQGREGGGTPISLHVAGGGNTRLGWASSRWCQPPLQVEHALWLFQAELGVGCTSDQGKTSSAKGYLSLTDGQYLSPYAEPFAKVQCADFWDCCCRSLCAGAELAGQAWCSEEGAGG